MTDPSRSEFGDFLRSRRERLSPRTVGHSNGRRRRTPGLRREANDDPTLKLAIYTPV
jgi:hypothetical protein